MGFEVSSEEIKRTAQKFKRLRESNPDLIGSVDEETLRNIANYLADKRRGDPEPDTWGLIKLGNIYSYACYIHEKTELDLLNIYSERRFYHGGALCEQYLFEGLTSAIC